MAVGGCLIKSKWGKGWTENDWIWWKKMQNELFYCLSADLWPPHCRLLVFFGHLEIKTNYLCGYRRPESILHLLLRPSCSLLPTFLRWLQSVKSRVALNILAGAPTFINLSCQMPSVHPPLTPVFSATVAAIKSSILWLFDGESWPDTLRSC